MRSAVVVDAVICIENVEREQVIACAEAAIAGMAGVSGPETHPAAYVLGALTAARACLVSLEAPDQWRAQLAVACEQAMRDVTGAGLPVQ